MSATSEVSDAVCDVASTAIGSVKTTVVPMLPSDWLIAWATAWTAAGWRSPTITTPLPFAATRSFTAAAKNLSAASPSDGTAPP
jgi:hypothetical protein